MNRLLLLGLNHATTPLAVREKLAFNAKQQREALDAFRAKFPNTEMVLLSTCNRVEMYVARASHGHPRVDEVMGFLAEFHNVPLEQFRSHLYEHKDRAVVSHLFTVASSLDSMVLGETQILGQVRGAYDTGRAAGTVGNMLNPLFQRALAVGKQVMSQTSLGEGRVSVASVAVDYAKRIFDHFQDKVVLSIGAGKMATLVLRHFAGLTPGKLLVCNRDQTKAQALASAFSGQAAPFEKLADHLAAADIVISSTGAPHPIITRAAYEPLRRVRRHRPIFMIDIALPRDMEASLEEFEEVYLYNLDDLQEVVAQTRSQRKEIIDAARVIVEQSVDEFTAWHRTRQLGPMIDALYKKYHQIAMDEVQRTLRKMPNGGPEHKDQLEELARRLVNKLLHDPMRLMRRPESTHAPSAQYLQAIERLFQLGETASGDDDSPADAASAADGGEKREQKPPT